MAWLREFAWFVRDMYRQWVGAMTASLSIVLAVAPLVFPAFFAGDKGLLRNQVTWWIASAIAFLIASRSAWGEERQKRIDLQKRWEDNSPMLGLEIYSFEGPKAWLTNATPVTMAIKLLTGRVPTSIHFDPLTSKSGAFRLKFDSLPHVDSPHPLPMRFEIEEVGKPKLSAKDRETTHIYERDMLLLFLNDAKEKSAIDAFPLTTRFSDKGEQRAQAFNLRWDWSKHGFLRDTT
jgi:hypothetical protein